MSERVLISPLFFNLFMKRTPIKIKFKICIDCSLPKPIFSRGRCRDCDGKYRSQKKIKENQVLLKRVQKAEKKQSKESLTDQLDDIFSLFIRLRYADENGMVKCFTSGAPMHYKEAHAGHFISRRHKSTRWDEINVQVQSYAENMHNQGNAPEFGRKIVEKYGQGVYDMLFIKKNGKFKWTAFEYNMQIQHYTQKVNELKNKLKIK